MAPNAYGRLFRRRKAAALVGQPPCSICGKPILRPAEGTLNHTVPVSDGGSAFHERPAHRWCNASHGGKLGAERSAKKRRARGDSRPKCWRGAIDFEPTGHEIIRPPPYDRRPPSF